VKLDSWHTIALPLFRRAFPAVPWVFLYATPVEVMVSQLRMPGLQMLPEGIGPQLYGIERSYGGACTRKTIRARALAMISASRWFGISPTAG